MQKYPGLQEEHTEAPLFENEPSAQRDGLIVPAEGQKFFSVQGEQDIAEVDEENVPAAHCVRKPFWQE